MPYNHSAATFRICRVELASHGVNLPCVPDDSVRYTSTNTDFVNDQALWNVGPLHNFALRSSLVDAEADTVRFRVAAQLVSLAPAAVGSTAWLPVGVSLDDETVFVGHTNVGLSGNTGVDVSLVIYYHYCGSNLRGGCLAGGVHVAFYCSHSRCSSIVGIGIVQVGYHY